MRLKTLEINGFKSFAQKILLEFDNGIVCVVGPNGSGKSNVVEAVRYFLGEQSIKSMRGKTGSDLIFKGSKNLAGGSRASVTIYFDNTDKVFKLSNDGGKGNEYINLNYHTISITRQVFGDGRNIYILNGTEVRLKDIHNLLASVNIGSSGHHIISQGETDRILSANAREKKEMVEDALGLKIYQYKIKESERKLERTNENMKEVSLMRRENAPHLNFLKKQVEKFEKTKEMQTELGALYQEYLKKEDLYLEKEKADLSSERNKLSNELKNVTGKISIVENNDPLRHSDTSPLIRGRMGGGKIEELRKIEEGLNSLRGVKSEIERKLGRIEGMVEMEERRKEQKSLFIEISQEEIKAIISEINNSIDLAFLKESIEEIRPVLESIKNILKKFSQNDKDESSHNLEIEKLKKTQQAILEEMKGIESKEKEIAKSIEILKQEINKEMEALRDLEGDKFAWRVRQQELSSALELVAIKEGNLAIS